MTSDDREKETASRRTGCRCFFAGGGRPAGVGLKVQCGRWKTSCDIDGMSRKAAMQHFLRCLRHKQTPAMLPLEAAPQDRASANRRFVHHQAGATGDLFITRLERRLCGQQTASPRRNSACRKNASPTASTRSGQRQVRVRDLPPEILFIRNVHHSNTLFVVAMSEASWLR
jgi:hypothetical protein